MKFIEVTVFVDNSAEEVAEKGPYVNVSALINPNKIDLIVAQLNHPLGPTVNTILQIDGTNLAITETIAEVMDKIDAVTVKYNNDTGVLYSNA